MTHLLPPSLIRLFAPRPPLEYIAPISRFDPDPSAPPPSKDPSRTASRRKTIRSPLTGVASYLERVAQDAADRGESTDDIAQNSTSFTLSRATIREMELEGIRKAKQEAKRRGLETYDPSSNPDATPDAYKTLFLARLSYDVTEADLHREFDMYGPITEIKLIRDREGKSRGYAFIAYERERDMKAAWKDAEGIKINGRRVMVDVERGRTVKDWKPKRLGGGLGGASRKPKKLPDPPEVVPGGFVGGAPPGGGFRGARGGAGGGFRGGRGGFNGRGGFRTPYNAPPPRQYDSNYNRGYPPSAPRYPSANRDTAYSRYEDPSSGPPAKRSRY